MCHQKNGSMCRGWLDCHGAELLAVRIGCVAGKIEIGKLQEALQETPMTPVFESGTDAAMHGMEKIVDPSPEAIRLMSKLENQRARKQRAKTV